MPSLHGMAADPQTSRPNLLSLVYQTIENTGGLWLVLRGGDDSLYRGGDVDLLVEPAVLDQLETDLPSLGFGAVPSAGKGSHRFFLGYDDETERWVRLDFVTRIDFGVHQELTTETASDLLHGRSKIENYWRLNDDDGFWYLFLHRYLGQRDLKPLELALLSLHAREAGPLADLVNSIGKSHASSTDILGLAREREWYGLEAVRSGFRRKWRRRRHGALRTRLHYRVDRLAHAVASISAPTGISITIIGPDGAGKTTLAEGLRETLPSFPPATSTWGCGGSIRGTSGFDSFQDCGCSNGWCDCSFELSRPGFIASAAVSSCWTDSPMT